MTEITKQNIDNLNAIKNLDELAEIKATLAPILARKKKLEMAVREWCMETGEVLNTDAGATSFRKSYTRKSWNGKGLLGYSVANPDVLEFLIEKEIGATVAIKLK